MRLTEEQMFLKAATVASRVHAKQLRKDGTPYIAHAIRVAIRVNTKHEKIVALLHDTVEDTDLTLDDLREIGFTEEIIESVDAMTRRPYESYAEFINRCKLDPIARVVKLADIDDNMEDQTALDPDEAGFLAKRYTKARATLESA